MTRGADHPVGRVLLVGDDAEVAAALHLHLGRAGWTPYCLAAPELLEQVLRTVAPQAIVLLLPPSPGAGWGGALTTTASAARVGVRVVVVAPSREVVEPLAAVAGAERALARVDVLARPLAVLERAPAVSPLPVDLTAPARPPPFPPAGFVPPRPPPAPGAPPPPPPAARAAAPRPPLPAELVTPPERTGRGVDRTTDLMALIDEELVDEPRNRPRATRIEVNVSLVSEHNFYVGPTRRIDSGGVFISTMLPPPIGTPLEIRLGLADGRRVEVRGEVVFLRERSAISGRQPAGCGARLHGLPGWAAEAIDRFLAARPPIVYVAP